MTSVRIPKYFFLFCIVMLCTFACFSQRADARDKKDSKNVEGYLTQEQYPNSFTLVPPPPERNSAGFALDESISRNGLSLRNTNRFGLATLDANYTFPDAANIFACTLGIQISQKETPHLYALLERVRLDVRKTAYAAKEHYTRKRPFLENNMPICTPDEKDKLAKESSYPSAHAAVGWAWALVLTEVDPENENAILQRGRAFGENRIVCNVHWYSDIVAGRMIGAAVVARLHAEKSFEKDLRKAQQELKKMRKRDRSPDKDCVIEKQALETPLILQ